MVSRRSRVLQKTQNKSSSPNPGWKARRTGSSTPLGHLVDHGCDCLTGMSQAGFWVPQHTERCESLPQERQFFDASNRQHAALVMILMPADMHWVFQCMRSIQPGPRFSLGVHASFESTPPYSF